MVNVKGSFYPFFPMETISGKPLKYHLKILIIYFYKKNRNNNTYFPFNFQVKRHKTALLKI
jgi:hypothetical protein